MKQLHHPMGFSSLQRRSLCPGSYHAEDGMPEIVTTDNAEGSFLHECVAMRKHPKEATLEQLERINSSIQLMDDVMAEESDVSIGYVEERLDIKDKNGNILLFGTVDFCCIDAMAKQGSVMDHKFGRIKVEDVENNLQLAAPTVALWQRYKVEKVTSYVNQPRCGKPQSFVFTNFQAIFDNIVAIIAKCKEPDAPRIPGTKQCRYCKNRELCVERQAQAAELVDLTQSISSVEALMALPAETLSSYYDKAKVLLEAIETLKTAVKEKASLDENKECGDYRLKEYRGKRGISDIQEAFSRIQENITAEDFRGACTVQITKLEDTYGRSLKASGHDITLKQAKIDLQEKLAGLIETKASSTRLERKG